MADEVNEENEKTTTTLVESLRLIVQSQLILDDLQRNQKKLEQLIASLAPDTEEK